MTTKQQQSDQRAVIGPLVNELCDSVNANENENWCISMTNPDESVWIQAIADAINLTTNNGLYTKIDFLNIIKNHPIFGEIIDYEKETHITVKILNLDANQLTNAILDFLSNTYTYSKDDFDTEIYEI